MANFTIDMQTYEKAYQQGRADAIDEFLSKIIRTYYDGNIMKIQNNDLCELAEQIKEQKK